MPHDRNNFPLVEGDKILIPARITKLTTSEFLCNLTCETEYPMKNEDGTDSTTPVVLTLCTSQVRRNNARADESST